MDILALLKNDGVLSYVYILDSRQRPCAKLFYVLKVTNADRSAQLRKTVVKQQWRITYSWHALVSYHFISNSEALKNRFLFQNVYGIVES